MVHRPGLPKARLTHAPDKYYVCGQLPRGKKQLVGGLTTIFREPAQCEAATATLRTALERLLKQEGLEKKDIIMGDVTNLVRIAVTKCDAALVEKIKALPEVKSVEPMGVAYPASGSKRRAYKPGIDN